MSESPQTPSVWGWRGAASGIAQRMQEIFENGERTDVLFAVGRQYGDEQQFRAHKFVLSLGSDVFDTMFHGEVPETNEKIELLDILPQAFGVMLKYLYTDVVEGLSLENVLATLYCAKKYGIPKLVDSCTEYAIKSIDKSTCFAMLEAAHVLDAENLVNKCLEIVDTHCSELLQAKAFLQLKNETLRVVFNQNIAIANEEEVYKAAERWAINTCRSNQLEPTAANRRVVLGEVLLLIRFPLMTDEQLASGPLATGLLHNEELLKIYQFKHAAVKPVIPFSDTLRSPHIVFCEYRWLLLENTDTGLGKMAAANVFIDKDERLHLRLSLHDGDWKGAGVRLFDALGFGRYEFNIKGLNRLDPCVRLVLYSQAENEPGVGISFDRVLDRRCPSCTVVRFSVFRPNRIGCAAEDIANYDKKFGEDVRTTHSYHRRSDSVLFSSQRGYQYNNTTEELCNWSYDFGPNIPRKALPLFICLTNPWNRVAYDAKDTEVIVSAFRFYPDD